MPHSASRELDALIAEQVMGWRRAGNHYVDESGFIRTLDLSSFGSFAPSTDIAAAWLVVENRRADGWWFSLVQDNEGIWDVCFWRVEPKGLFPRVEARAHEQNVAHSICRAALSTVEGA